MKSLEDQVLPSMSPATPRSGCWSQSGVVQVAGCRVVDPRPNRRYGCLLLKTV